MAKDKKDQGIENIIYRAVEAGRISAERSARDAFKATERRLYAVPDLRAKLKDDQEELEDTRKYGLKERSHSITRFFKSGVRLTPEEIMEQIEERDNLYTALDQLPPVQGRRVYAHYILGKSKTDIAKSENVSENAVRDSISRGMEMMKNILKKFR